MHSSALFGKNGYSKVLFYYKIIIRQGRFKVKYAVAVGLSRSSFLLLRQILQIYDKRIKKTV